MINEALAFVQFASFLCAVTNLNDVMALIMEQTRIRK